MKLIPTSIAMMLAATTLIAAAAEPSPDARLTITEVVEKLEQQGYGPFLEVSSDDGFWEVEVYKDGVPRELTVDRQTAKVLADHADDGGVRPPRDAKALSEILRQLSQAGRSRINEVSFERRYWEVELIEDNLEHELHVDPRTGKIVSDRIDY